MGALKGLKTYKSHVSGASHFINSKRTPKPAPRQRRGFANLDHPEMEAETTAFCPVSAPERAAFRKTPHGMTRNGRTILFLNADTSVWCVHASNIAKG